MEAEKDEIAEEEAEKPEEEKDELIASDSPKRKQTKKPVSSMLTFLRLHDTYQSHFFLIFIFSLKLMSLVSFINRTKKLKSFRNL